MKKLIVTGLTLTPILLAANASAANFAVITSPPTALNLVILIAAIACIFGAAKISSILRGGLLSKSWQVFIFGFVALAIAELSILFNDFEIFIVPNYIAPALILAAVGLIFYGLYSIKQTLE